jgi:predicted AlkP superfamily phosphohydrolase/phosphomutase
MLLIVGWDGASPSLVERWLRAGRLPNLDRVWRTGHSGVVEPPWPPVTFPSWTTFMTGVNPGRHGIFDFTRRIPGTYRVQFVNAANRKAPSVWSLLSASRKRVCVLGLPATYPPEPVNGVLLSGFDTPVTTRADASFVYPRERAREILEAGGFPFADFQEFRVSQRWYAVARERLLAGIEQKTRLAEKLLRKERWDCFLILFGESDTAAHHFWHFHDRLSPFYVGSNPFENVLAEVYEALDAALGRLCSTVPEADLLVLSDHGFGGAGTTRVYLNRWLAEHGWLKFQRRNRRGSAFSAAAKSVALAWVPARWQARLFRWGGYRWASALETSTRFAGVDFAASAAFSEELGYFPSIWLNVKGRDPEGIVDAQGYEQLRAEIRTALLHWRHPQTGRALVRRVWLREELYAGPWVGEAPDILIQFDEEPPGYAIVASQSNGEEGPAVRELDLTQWRGGKMQGLSGTHRRLGIFAVAGPSVRGNGSRVFLKMEQLAPTIMEMCGLHPPEELFDGESFAHVVRAQNAAEFLLPSREEDSRAYTEAEEREITERLKNLGYFE